MRYFIFITFLWAFAMVSHAQTHVRKAIDNMLSEHPEWVINSGKSESAIKSGTQSNRIYELSITDLTAIDSLLSAFDADKWMPTATYAPLPPTIRPCRNVAGPLLHCRTVSAWKAIPRNTASCRCRSWTLRIRTIEPTIY